MDRMKSMRLIALVLAIVVVCSVFAGCKPTSGKDATTTAPTQSTTLMPGYIDDNGTQAQTDADSTKETEDSLEQYRPDGPIKGENNNSQQNNSQGNQTNTSDKTTKPASTEAVKPSEIMTTVQTNPVQETTEDKTETPATEPVADTTDATEAPVEKETTDATEVPVEKETTRATEETTPAQTEPDFTLPELPDSDIIGPKPPVNPDDIILPEFTTSAQETTETEAETTVQSTTAQPQIPTQVTTEPVATAPVDLSGRLKFTYYGSYSGQFVEDGTDEYVQNVAILLVTNISKDYLEYAVITFDIDGEAAAFVATGLAPGESAWVLEKNRLNVSKGAVFTHVDDIASFVKYTSPYDTGVAVALSEGQLAVRNNTGKDLSNVYVYYKQVHTDGNFLGGITYRVPIGNLQADEEASSVAMHCNAANCKVVSITYTEEG